MQLTPLQAIGKAAALLSELGRKDPCALEAQSWFLSVYVPLPTPPTHIMKNCHAKEHTYPEAVPS